MACIAIKYSTYLLNTLDFAYSNNDENNLDKENYEFKS